MTVIESGNAIEKPIKEPKVTRYNAVIDHVCLFLKIENCLAMFSFIVPKAASFIISKVDPMMSGMATHIFSSPKPVGAAKYKYKPAIAGTNARVYSQVILMNASKVLRASAEIGSRLFMPQKHKIASGTKDITQAKPAF